MIVSPGGRMLISPFSPFTQRNARARTLDAIFAGFNGGFGVTASRESEDRTAPELPVYAPPPVQAVPLPVATPVPVQSVPLPGSGYTVPPPPAAGTIYVDPITVLPPPLAAPPLAVQPVEVKAPPAYTIGIPVPPPPPTYPTPPPVQAVPIVVPPPPMRAPPANTPMPIESPKYADADGGGDVYSYPPPPGVPASIAYGEPTTAAEAEAQDQIFEAVKKTDSPAEAQAIAAAVMAKSPSQLTMERAWRYGKWPLLAIGVYLLAKKVL